MRVVFLGTPEFSVPSLQALIASADFEVRAVLTQPDRPAGRSRKLKASPVKSVAESASIPVLQPKRLRQELDSVIPALLDLGPFDIGVVVAYGQILPPRFLELPQQGCLNIHASLLPRWRGAAPIQRAIMAGDTESGVCLMRMEEGLDTGPVYSRERVRIEPTTTGGELHNRLAALGAELLIRDLSEILNGNLKAETQPTEGVTYASKLEKEEAYLCWHRPAFELDRLIHAFDPFPGAVTAWRQDRLKLFDSTPVQMELGDKIAGQVITVDEDSFTVQCSDGALKIGAAQLPGRKRLSAREFLRGSDLHVGEILAGIED